ncbi:FAD-binding oxidoreductase [Ponticoccus alexandrii]|uniref:Flavodoxin reductase n=1 Tax=Ponticoccus alexandrii TaxID=1943633 RepID=A0ABX7FCZ8_9RHOB|nr:FAD-binding oxidoreductase [Ponticoccus alexandrii]ETA52852.1 flavodoxin reductase [Rhodobacteraceae bacterium PD-2]QRF67687.1 flavodoxin reductase [Ponticoccus alexandrii]
MTYRITLKSTEPVTHDTHRLTFEKPEAFDFTPGQATDFALDRDGWREERRPFTFTSLPGDDHLEFTIKSYPDHDGVTKRIGQMTPGDTALIADPWGAIEDKGDGVFIAGGAGVTPFIAILRNKLAKMGSLQGNTLVFSNTTDRDIILRQEFEAMPGLNCYWTVTDQPGSPLAHGQIDAELLSTLVVPGRDTCYICGPDPMIGAMQKALDAVGVPKARVVTEDFG